MALNLGMVRPGSTLLVPFHTFTSDDPSASVAIADFVLADIGIYKGTSMTERASTTGVVLLDTDGIDIDLAVGIGGFSIDLSSNAAAGFYSAGSHYYVTVGPVTIDGATVNFVAATFSIGFPDAIINTTVASATSDTQFILTDGPAEADVLIGCPILIQALASAAGVGIQIGHCIDYIVTTKEVFLGADPGGGTVTAADHIGVFMPPNVNEIRDAILPKINTALSDIPFVMVLSTDHVSPATGLTPVATRSIDGGTTFSATTGSVAEAANGLYHFDASAADMDGAIVTFKFSVATADDTLISIRTGG